MSRFVVALALQVFSRDLLLILCNSRGVTPDRTVSDKHLRVYCLAYDPNASSLPPLVYVEDSSTNGTWVEVSGVMKRIGRGSGPVLLDDGDVLYLGAHTVCVFECKKTGATARDDPTPARFEMSPTQQREIQARPGPLPLG
jgi:pSer/pThr/pTyr-binding forkhead associated (FHA) protein